MSFKEYFEYYQKYTKKYDGCVAVLIQCGSFFEIYGIDNETEIINPQLPHLSNILNMTLSRKNKKIKENNIQNPQFVGFPMYALQKYIPVLLDHSYTVVIVEQVTDAPKPQRKVTQILSPGTKLDYFRDDTNNLVSIYFENNNKKLFIGLSSIDFSTGTSVTYETHSNIDDEDLCLDEVFKFITSQSPKEILISSHNLQNTFITNDYLLKNLNLHNTVTHISLQNIDPIYFNTSYQNDFLRKIYNPPFMTPIEFLDLEHYHFSTISFLKLLQFAYEHNENIICSIQKPNILTNTSQLYLLNNTIKQLNLYEKSGNISLFSLINHTSTVMGKRLLKSHLLNPITNINTLNTRYNFIEDMTNTYEQYEKILKNIIDLERLHRRIQLGILNPTEFISIDNSYSYVLQLDKLCKSSKNNLVSLKLSKIQKFKKLIKKYNTLFNFHQLAISSTLDIYNNSFLNPGVNPIIDEIQLNIDSIYTKFNQLSKQYSNSIDSSKDDLVKLETNDKDGFYLTLTNIRSKILSKKYPDLTFKNNKTSCKIVSPELSSMSDQLIILQSKIKNNLKSIYLDFLSQFSLDGIDTFPTIINFVSYLDLVKSSSKTAVLYNYSKPIITPQNDSFLNATQLRHPIIERIHTKEKYVPNDISLTNDHNGLLLFAINSAGKSSLLKAIGINLIMAQAGLYVPSQTFEFSPFDYIISRIQGGDDLIRGHSSFVLEMLELRSILNKSTSNTLVLGDELCRGTEHVSALAIVTSTILDLAKRHTKFIFATHLHELTNIPDITSLPNVDFYNLAVTYNESDNKLVYNRTLQPGSGSNMYGLEVAKSMDLSPHFINKAMEIRRNILDINQHILTPKKSKYNSSIFVSECNICNSTKNLDTHHINFQCTANDKGFIDHFHKNIDHNLVILCKPCHNKVHDKSITIHGYQTTSNGLELNFQINN